MDLIELKPLIPELFYNTLTRTGITSLRPAQTKAIKAGLLDGKNIVVCTPTASGKTLIAELAGIKRILNENGIMVYVVPLKALASEKTRDFKNRYEPMLRIALSIGDAESSEPYLRDYNIIVCTAEKLDSLIRNHATWLHNITTLIIDEIHLLNDPNRGPTLEIVITLLRQIIKNMQIIGLSATIGNPQELADWLDAKLVIDDWRPVPLTKGIFHDNTIEFD
ncbi:MAG: DEAD/DEAH box helicase [Nanoarchaeota archaeon]